ncbi:hypothetical protein PHJA_002970800 [Phtheirospermum japonicum]|uniref:Uncharacterized protein n=1 Tax=Phtheirospermum japonicum TaxID=374723 RepID=A0A830D6W0_9LAMI|nr:hypothetical protein PHJA_002970800 [Phtheirospermum japonicum]
MLDIQALFDLLGSARVLEMFTLWDFDLIFELVHELALTLVCLSLGVQPMEGKVVLAFEENGSSKIGVRFDRSIPEGNGLGGHCEEDRGFFCAADLLRLESSSADDVEKLVINELFEVASIECKSSPLILYLKDIEKSLAANFEAYVALKGLNRPPHKLTDSSTSFAQRTATNKESLRSETLGSTLQWEQRLPLGRYLGLERAFTVLLKSYTHEERQDQARYFYAHVISIQRRLHDIREKSRIEENMLQAKRDRLVEVGSS